MGPERVRLRVHPHGLHHVRLVRSREDLPAFADLRRRPVQGEPHRVHVPDGPQADCWIYEDLVYINKRHVAAVGFDRDDMTMSPITYDEMRPGCYEPKARIEDMEMNHVEASLSFPTFPRFCGQTFLEAIEWHRRLQRRRTPIEIAASEPIATR